MFTNLKKRFEHIELPAKLLDYFLRSNNRNINQSWPRMSANQTGLFYKNPGCAFAVDLLLVLLTIGGWPRSSTLETTVHTIPWQEYSCRCFLLLPFSTLKLIWVRWPTASSSTYSNLYLTKCCAPTSSWSISSRHVVSMQHAASVIEVDSDWDPWRILSTKQAWHRSLILLTLVSLWVQHASTATMSDPVSYVQGINSESRAAARIDDNDWFPYPAPDSTLMWCEFEIDF